MNKKTILDTDIPTLTRQWQLYLERSNIKEASMPPVQHSEMKKAFMGACAQTIISLRDDVSTYEEEMGIKILQSMLDEIGDYFNEEIKRYDAGGTQSVHRAADRSRPGKDRPSADVRDALVSAKGDLSPMVRKIRKLIRQQYGSDSSAFVIVFTHPEHDEMVHFATNINNRGDAATLLAEMSGHIRSGLN